MATTPLFIFSMPRSGSTLLQRILGAHPEIATAAEPWLLLPLAGMSGADGVATYANYSHRGAVEAVADLQAALDGGKETYRSAMAGFVEALYDAAGGRETTYFLDKTPRYFLIVDFILDLFPDAKANLLTRNPLDVAASIVNSWGGGRLWLHPGVLDLFEGPVRLHEARERHAARLHCVSYERLVADTEGETRAILDYLDLDFDPAVLADASVASFSGSMGDKSVKSRDPAVRADSVGRWRKVFATPVRRAFLQRYLRRLGPAVLAANGVDYDEVIREVNELPVSWRSTFSDLGLLSASFVGPGFAANLVRREWQRKTRLPIAKLD